MSAILANRVFGINKIIKKQNLFKELQKLIPFVLIGLDDKSKSFCKIHETNIGCNSLIRIDNDIISVKKDTVFLYNIGCDCTLTIIKNNNGIILDYGRNDKYLIKRLN